MNGSHSLTIEDCKEGHKFTVARGECAVTRCLLSLFRRGSQRALSLVSTSHNGQVPLNALRANSCPASFRPHLSTQCSPGGGVRIMTRTIREHCRRVPVQLEIERGALESANKLPVLVAYFAFSFPPRLPQILANVSF